MKHPLHLVLAKPSRQHGSKRGAPSFDVGGNTGVRWRGEKPGGEDTREAMAYRLSLCWNLMVGWKNEILLGGVFRTQDDLTHAVLDAEPYSEAQAEAIEKLREHMAMRDKHYDPQWRELYPEEPNVDSD